MNEPAPATATEPAPATAISKRPMGWIPRILIAGGSLGTALGIGLALIFGSYKLPSGSMWPTLAVGERLFGNKLAKQPFRGSLMIFRYPEHRDSLFAKRIVGLAGDVVAIHRGELVINGWSVPRCTVGRATQRDPTMPGEDGKHEGTLSVEWLGLATYLVFDEKTSFGSIGEGSEWKVAPGEYFTMGDNRNNSHDSRAWFQGKGGGVPLGDTIGRVVGHEAVVLPPGAEELGPALAACLAKRPEQTDPPPAK
ncbi:MAG: Signal peptidase [Myxococcaceae bacterium]|nr:Signal peptidase [Myxococcaceae bacterium]MEA2748851.1 signal peptidase [Myxococcales bacterium]